MLKLSWRCSWRRHRGLLRRWRIPWWRRRRRPRPCRGSCVPAPSRRPADLVVVRAAYPLGPNAHALCCGCPFAGGHRDLCRESHRVDAGAPRSHGLGSLHAYHVGCTTFSSILTGMREGHRAVVRHGMRADWLPPGPAERSRSCRLVSDNSSSVSRRARLRRVFSARRTSFSARSLPMSSLLASTAELSWADLSAGAVPRAEWVVLLAL